MRADLGRRDLLPIYFRRTACGRHASRIESADFYCGHDVVKTVCAGCRRFYFTTLRECHTDDEGKRCDIIRVATSRTDAREKIKEILDDP